jgi:hypothetical protein
MVSVIDPVAGTVRSVGSFFSVNAMGVADLGA